MLSFFEKRVDPYPAGDPATPPQGFAAFLWSATQGMRPLILGMTLCTAAIGMFEALLFAMLGNVVDWLTQTPMDELWERQRTNMLLLGGILLASPLLVLVQTLIKHQALAGNFPMRLRWVFHRHMLGQSLAFYQDEFAGRVATKVMQTALAVRDTWMIVADIMVFVGIYFITMVAVVGSFDAWVLLPFLGWLALYVLALVWFVPRLGKVAKAQADARSLMVGRITDAYTNIATVKLFSHGRREATFAKGAMQEFMGSVHAQMRLITGVEITNHVLSMALIGSTAGVTVWLWTQGQVGVGAVAAATAMALRLNGISHWIMWEFAALFEHIGTVQDGITTLSRAPTVVDAADARPLSVGQGEIEFDSVDFAYGAAADAPRVLQGLNLRIRPGEKIGLVGRSGAGKSTIVNLLLRFYDVRSGRVLLHQRRVGVEFGRGADHDLVQQLAAVAHHQAQRLAFAHLDAVGLEAHVVAHGDVDRARHGPGVAGDAPGLLLLLGRSGCAAVVVLRPVGAHAAGSSQAEQQRQAEAGPDAAERC